MISAFIPCSCCSRSTTIWSLWYHRLLLCDGPNSNPLKTSTENSPTRWSDLPPELWDVIGNRLETNIDILRFRSVCSSWRQASLPPIYSPPPNLSNLRRKKIFHMIPLRRSRTSSGSSKQQSKLHFTKMFSSRLMYDNEARGNESTLNLLNFRINQVAEAYYKINFRSYVHKIIIAPNSATTIVGVFGAGKLGFTKQEGNNVWTLVDECNKNYDDVMVYKKKIYAMNRWGEIFRITNSMKLVKLPVPPCGYGNRKYLVNCGGEIHVVNRLVDESRKVREFEVYRLDEEQGRWNYVKNLGNYSIVLRKDCSFCINEGIKGNCIYFNYPQDWSMNPSIAALFDLKHRSFMNLV